MKMNLMNLGKYVGKKVKLAGTIAENPYQHLIQFDPEYPHINYINLENGDQIVVYSSKPLEQIPNKMLKIKGTVIEVIGSSKRPNAPQLNDYKEYQIRID